MVSCFFVTVIVISIFRTYDVLYYLIYCDMSYAHFSSSPASMCLFKSLKQFLFFNPYIHIFQRAMKLTLRKGTKEKLTVADTYP